MSVFGLRLRTAMAAIASGTLGFSGVALADGATEPTKAGASAAHAEAAASSANSPANTAARLAALALRVDAIEQDLTNSTPDAAGSTGAAPRFAVREHSKAGVGTTAPAYASVAPPPVPLGRPRLTNAQLPVLRNDLMLRAALGQPTERTPVWLMRQAGRYLPEFREMRGEADFFRVCRTPALACEVTMQPLRRFPLDAAIIFSDILVVPQAMGMDVRMVKGRGPVFPAPLAAPADLEKLHLTPDVHETLGYVLDAINETRVAIDGAVPLIGFAGAPWTLMVYMVEGGASPTKAKAKTWLYKHPEASHKLLQALTDVLVEYLVAQHEAGAQALQVFETVGASELTPEHISEFVTPYLEQIARRVRARVGPDVPLICFCKDTHAQLPLLASMEYDVLGLDWKIKRKAARAAVDNGAAAAAASEGVEEGAEVEGTVPRAKAVQGNLDPAVLHGGKAVIRAEVARMLEEFGTQGLIANLGHGLTPSHTPVAVGEFVHAVQSISLEMNEATAQLQSKN